MRSMKPSLPTDADQQLQLLSFYRFVPISQPAAIRDTLFERLQTIDGVRGTVYVAKEGINAQFAVPVGKPVEELLQIFGKKGIDEDDDTSRGGCLPFDTFEKNAPNMGNIVGSDTPTFDRLIVRTRNYILRDGIIGEQEQDTEDSLLDWDDAGMELDPSEWDEQLRQQPDIQLLDCRNTYESDEGTFVSSTPLNTQTFSDTWNILDSEVASKSLDPSKPVHIFCTGGIRCVKVGAYLKQKLGFEDVRSLKHGIIGYERWNKEENDSKTDSLWQGENFLFDKRRFAKDGENGTDEENKD